MQPELITKKKSALPSRFYFCLLRYIWKLRRCLKLRRLLKNSKIGSHVNFEPNRNPGSQTDNAPKLAQLAFCFGATHQEGKLKLKLFSAKGGEGGYPFAENSAKIINLIFEPFPNQLSFISILLRIDINL